MKPLIIILITSLGGVIGAAVLGFAGFLLGVSVPDESAGSCATTLAKIGAVVGLIIGVVVTLIVIFTSQSK